MPRLYGHSGQLTFVEGVVSNCVLTLIVIQSRQVRVGCTQPGVSGLEGNASATLTLAQTLHSV